MILKRVIAGIIATALLLGASWSWANERSKVDPPSYDTLRVMADILTIVESDYVEPVETQVLIEQALQGALSKLDPHSGYVPPVTFTEQRKAVLREYGGLGIEVTMEDEMIKINYTVDDGPAYKSGIRKGDFITAVEGESIIGKSLDEAVSGIRGLAGDPVVVTVLTPENNVRDLETARDVTVIRQKVRGRAIQHRVEDGLGYVYIESFNNAFLTDDLAKAIGDLKSELGDPFPGMIIDIRGNRGGLLTQSVSVTGLFLDGGEVLSVRGRKDIDTERYHAEDGELLPNTPIVVLISPGSASAAEILAGALQDRGRAVVVGRRSFGKGSVQSVIPLSDQNPNLPRKGALRLTTQRYYTPSGKSIQGRGIMPDFLVSSFDDTGKLRRRFREDSLPNALTNSDRSEYEEDYDAVTFPPEDLPDTVDFQLQTAVKILKSDQYQTLLDAQSDLD